MKMPTIMTMIALSCIPSVAAAQRGQAGRTVEDIYIVRSLRTSRGTPTDFCAEGRTGFASTYEDRYTFHAVTTRPSDARLVDPRGNQVGQLRACFGGTRFANFYAEGDLASLAFTGRGECASPRADFPEGGINVFRCFLDLTNLPRGYIGGLLTTNSVRSRQDIGPTSDPAGYVQSSIATVRLWKER